ncbi:ParE toxin of type II toxin-antitoxin system, parDE [Candidatus Burarchaeum australiense]|nr:ParE toxin of type II toxin-antitoxin system, parDE [Candidatus Burarchaeum australiense]
MYGLERYPACDRSIKRKCRKNREMQDALEAKITEILQNPHAFKPLRAPLEGLRRVHVLKSFVLVYKINEARNVVELVNFLHHDEAY